MSFFNKPLASLTFADIHQLVNTDKQRESVLLDYKSGVNPTKLSEDIAKDVSSFANHLGGYLVYGVKDNGSGVPVEICGISSAETLKNQVVQICAHPSNLNPPIFLADPKILEGDLSGKKVACLIVKIEESPALPHFYLGGTSFYLRSADTNQPIEGTPEMMKLLENRRAKTLEAQEAQLSECRDHSLRWLAQAYGITSNAVHIPAPCFAMSLQPRLFSRDFHDARKIREAMEKALSVLKQNFKWPGQYTYSYFDTRRFESYASTWVHRWKEESPSHIAMRPNLQWSSASSTGLLYHLEDLPYKHRTIEPGADKPKHEYGFHPGHALSKVLSFLMFAREYHAALQKDALLDLRVEFYEMRDMLPLYNEREQRGRRIIENHFIIERSISTLQMDQAAIESLVIGGIAPELLLAINYEPGHTFDAHEVKDVMRVVRGE